MGLAYEDFEKIDAEEDILKKHRLWLKAYEGMAYSIATEGKHLMKWMKDPKYYYDKLWKPDINLIKELKNRCRIEFDGDEELAREYLEEVYQRLKKEGWGFIRSSHEGKTDYLWIEFTRDLTDKEKQSFLVFISPENAEVDLNFASSRRVFPIMYATHWKYPDRRERPQEYFKGNQIDFDGLKIPVKQKFTKKVKKSKEFEYVTGIKEASKVFTLEDQADRFNEIQPLFYDRAGLWWLWNNKIKCWELSDEVDILNMISETTKKDVISSKNRTEILNALKQKGRLNIPKPIKPTWIQFKDKVYDISNGESFVAEPKYFVTNPIPQEVSLNPETPVMDKIFAEWVGEEYRETLYEILAYCLLPDYPIHRLFCFIGEGLNGKSCFLRLLQKFIGKENICATELDTLISSRFEVTRLHRKLACIMGETNFNEMDKTSIIKKLTGQDIIGFEYKNKNPFEETNYAKILIATNNLPATTDKTIGFYRRWILIDFPNRFNEKKDILNDIPEEEYSNLATKCLTTLNKLLQQRNFTNEGSIEARMKRYEDRSNPFGKFWVENVEENPDSDISKKQFFEKFSEWCKENRFRAMSERTIAKHMKEKGIETFRKTMDWIDVKFGEDKPRYWTWGGIKWK